MKRLIIFLVSLCLMLPAAVAQNKALQKELKKEYQKKIKEFNGEGWKLYGSTRTLEVSLLKHYEKLNDGDNVYEIMGTCSRFKSKNVGHQTCLNNAANIYASQAGRKLKGRIVSDLAGDADNPDNEFDHFYGAYESLVQKEINGELKESFSVIKDNGDGTFEMQTYFTIDEQSASNARIRAFENAKKESEAAQKMATQISDFIKEGFDPNEE